MKRILVKHVGNMGDMVFFVPPVLETLKRLYPESHITFVTAWGFKKTARSIDLSLLKQGKLPLKKYAAWGERNQSGFCISLMMTNPHVDQLVHWHDTKTDLDGNICREEGRSFPTWSAEYYEEQKQSGTYDAVYELDFGIEHDANPLADIYASIGLPEEYFTNYKLYFSEEDKKVAQAVIEEYPSPRIVILEGLEGVTTRGWDPGKIPQLENVIEKKYGVRPIWFGGKYQRYYEGRPLTLRENIATLLYCDVGIGVLSGPLHFAAAAGLPTITLYGDQPLHRTAPAYFLNEYIPDKKKRHRTLLGPTGPKFLFLKEGSTLPDLSPTEKETQNYTSWLNPGRQSTKSCISVITPEEVMTVLRDIL